MLAPDADLLSSTLGCKSIDDTIDATKIMPAGSNLGLLNHRFKPLTPSSSTGLSEVFTRLLKSFSTPIPISNRFKTLCRGRIAQPVSRMPHVLHSLDDRLACAGFGMCTGSVTRLRKKAATVLKHLFINSFKSVFTSRSLLQDTFYQSLELHRLVIHLLKRLLKTAHRETLRGC